MDYEIRDIGLRDEGKKKVEYAEKRMAALVELGKEVKDRGELDGKKIGMALHITKETAVLVKVLMDCGASVRISSCNPLSTQDDVAAHLVDLGAEAFGKRGESEEEYARYIEKVASFYPDIAIDDGGDLTVKLHEMENIPIGVCEETTTGVIRLRAMEKNGKLKCPVIAVNDNKTKHLFDNYYGTGQSSLDGILRSTNVLFAGKTVVVCGYGNCGKGIAERSKGMGARVIVCEVDPVKALQAYLDGHRVMRMDEACKTGDIFITATGNKGVIRKEHVEHMKDGAILANAGHFNVEIDVESLNKEFKKEKVRENLGAYNVNEKRIYLCSEGRLVNLASAEGHPSEVMSSSFCGQLLACEYLCKKKGALENSVMVLPDEIDRKIAMAHLKMYGVKIDQLTDEQIKYLNEWREGT